MRKQRTCLSERNFYTSAGLLAAHSFLWSHCSFFRFPWCITKVNTWKWKIEPRCRTVLLLLSRDWKVHNYVLINYRLIAHENRIESGSGCPHTSPRPQVHCGTFAAHGLSGVRLTFGWVWQLHFRCSHVLFTSREIQLFYRSTNILSVSRYCSYDPQINNNEWRPRLH